MRKFLAFVFLLGSIGGAYAQAGPPPTGPAYSFVCNASVASSFTTPANSAAVVGVQGKGIYICGWHATTLPQTNVNSQATFQLFATTSTSTNTCLTTTPSIALTPVNGVTSTAPSVDHGTVAGLFTPNTATISASTLCLVVGGASAPFTANLQILLYYGQY